MPSLIHQLTSQPFFKVIGSFLNSPEPRYLRELSKELGLSPAGVSDAIRRLKKIGVLKEKKIGNKKFFSLELIPEERECLSLFFKESEKRTLEKRARRFSKHAQQKLQWMDDTYEFYRNLKKNGYPALDTKNRG